MRAGEGEAVGEGALPLPGVAIGDEALALPGEAVGAEEGSSILGAIKVTEPNR